MKTYLVSVSVARYKHGIASPEEIDRHGPEALFEIHYAPAILKAVSMDIAARKVRDGILSRFPKAEGWAWHQVAVFDTTNEEEPLCYRFGREQDGNDVLELQNNWPEFIVDSRAGL